MTAAIPGQHEMRIDARVRLRPWRADDLDSLVHHANDARIVRGLSARFPHPYTRVDGQAFLSGRVIDLSDPVFAIDIDGHAVGGIGLHPGKGERAIGAELGYWLGTAFWGQGLMTRIVGHVVPWAMQTLSLLRVQATVFDFNQASARVLEHNDFVEEGTMRRAARRDGVVHDLRLFARTRASLDG